MAIVWLPLLYFVGGLALVSLDARRARAEADAARSAVRPGSTVSELVGTTSAPVGRSRRLGCYEAACVDPPGFLLAKRPGGWSGSFAAGELVERFVAAGELRRLDDVACRRVKITYCGRPWMTFVVEVDAQRRVSRIGGLGVSPD